MARGASVALGTLRFPERLKCFQNTCVSAATPSPGEGHTSPQEVRKAPWAVAGPHHGHSGFVLSRGLSVPLECPGQDQWVWGLEDTAEPVGTRLGCPAPPQPLLPQDGGRADGRGRQPSGLGRRVLLGVVNSFSGGRGGVVVCPPCQSCPHAGAMLFLGRGLPAVYGCHVPLGRQLLRKAGAAAPAWKWAAGEARLCPLSPGASSRCRLRLRLRLRRKGLGGGATEGWSSSSSPWSRGGKGSSPPESGPLLPTDLQGDLRGLGQPEGPGPFRAQAGPSWATWPDGGWGVG